MKTEEHFLGFYCYYSHHQTLDQIGQRDHGIEIHSHNDEDYDDCDDARNGTNPPERRMRRGGTPCHDRWVMLTTVAVAVMMILITLHRTRPVAVDWTIFHTRPIFVKIIRGHYFDRDSYDYHY